MKCLALAALLALTVSARAEIPDGTIDGDKAEAQIKAHPSEDMA